MNCHQGRFRTWNLLQILLLSFVGCGSSRGCPVALAQPLRDVSGVVVPHDHPEIIATDKVLRRVSPEHHVVVDGGGQRISTMAFEPSKDAYRGLSVDLERSILEARLDPKLFVTTPRFVGSVWLAAGAARAEGLSVGYDPLPENPHHGEIWGIASKAVKRKLLKLAQWYVEIAGVSISQS